MMKPWSLSFVFLIGLSASALLLPENAWASSKVAIIEAQQLIDEGDMPKAIAFLEAKIIEYPNVSPLLSLYGEALYENGQMEEAEAVYRQVLELNPLDANAARMVETIRAINDASVSEQAQLVEELTWDKMFDLLTMAMAFSLGSLLSRYIRRISDWNFSRRSRKLFLRNSYDDFVDLLEIQISTNELRPLRHSVEFMLLHKTEDEIIDMLERYVNTQENLQTLTRMVKLSLEHKKTH